MTLELKEEIRKGGITYFNRPSSIEWDEEFMREMGDDVPWLFIAQYENLSVDVCREFKDRFNWKLISAFQKFDFNFVKEFRNELSWGMVTLNDELSKEDKEKFIEYLKGINEEN